MLERFGGGSPPLEGLRKAEIVARVSRGVGKSLLTHRFVAASPAAQSFIHVGEVEMCVDLSFALLNHLFSAAVHRDGAKE